MEGFGVAAEEVFGCCGSSDKRGAGEVPHPLKTQLYAEFGGS